MQLGLMIVVLEQYRSPQSKKPESIRDDDANRLWLQACCVIICVREVWLRGGVLVPFSWVLALHGWGAIVPQLGRRHRSFVELMK